MKNYWIMKTSRDDDGGNIEEDFWEEFKDSKKNDGKTVIAIGWLHNHSLDPNKVTKKEVQPM